MLCVLSADMCPTLFLYRGSGFPKVDFCQLMVRSVHLVTLEQLCCRVCSLAFGLPKQLGLCVRPNSWDRLQRVLVLHDDELLCFDWFDQARRTLRRRCKICGMPKECEWSLSLFESYSESEWSPFLSWTCDLHLRMVQHSRIFDVKLPQTSLSLSWQCDPILRLVCPRSYGTTLILVQIHRNTNELTGNAV